MSLLERGVLISEGVMCSPAVSLLQKIPSTQRSEVTNELLVAIKSITDNKVDYRY